MRKNSYSKILKGKPKKQHLCIVPKSCSILLMYILLWALGPLGPITLLVQHTYTCTALYLYRTLMPPI